MQARIGFVEFLRSRMLRCRAIASGRRNGDVSIAETVKIPRF
ncbi:hypothetical protein [Lysobacter sp. ESA13C]|nr:hypothetical protein [Lysobacter sp. ESA13C]